MTGAMPSWDPARLVPGCEDGFAVDIDAGLHAAFTGLSGDDSPVHADPAFAARTRFGGVIGHAALLHALLSRLYGCHLPGGSSVCLRQEARYPNPFRPGDRLTVRGTVESFSPATGILTIRTVIRRPDGLAVLDGTGTVQVCFTESDRSPLYQAAGGPVYAADVAAALQRTGIAAGDTIFVHSDITGFGRLAARGRTALLDGLCQGLAAAVGAKGAVLMPVFTYSACRGEVFEVETTPSAVGVLGEHFRRLPGAVRGTHPIFSVAARGADAAALAASGPDAFGDGSVFARLEERDAWLVFLGAPLQSMTQIHRVEQLRGCSYRFIKAFPARIRQGGVETAGEATFFCRHLDRDVVLDLGRLGAALAAAGVLHEAPLGDGVVRAVRVRAVAAVANRLLDDDPWALLAHPPTEPPCPR